jgi:acyl-CoA synthetase (NDP forming)
VKQTEQYSHNRDAIATLFDPRSIAVVGSLREGRFGGYVTVKNLLSFGFQGKVYPVNPQYDTVLGLKVYPRVKEIPDSVDLAVMMTSARTVPEIIGDCVQKKVKVAIIVADGFSERNEEGLGLQRQVEEIAWGGGVRLLGPNTVGVTNPATGVVTTPYKVLYKKIFSGSIALCGQTGLIGPQALPLEDMRYGISKICDFGNKCDIDEVDLLEYLAEDPQTKVIGMHLEGVRDGPSFIDAVRKAVTKKPVLILKPGKTGESMKAMASHTGSLAGENQVYEAAFKQAGAIRVDTFRDLIDLPKVFAAQPLPAGNRLAIITFSGGAGVMGIDTAVQHGLSLARLSPKTMDRLAKISPVLASNPVDLGPALPAYMGGMAPYLREMTEAVLEDENVDCISAVCPWALRGEVSQFFGSLREKNSKTVAFWVPNPSLSGAEEMTRDLEALGFPAYPDCETSVKALATAFRYSVIRAKMRRSGEAGS